MVFSLYSGDSEIESNEVDSGRRAAFYGDSLKSQKLAKEAATYFKQKVEEYGVNDDGFDPVIEMIPVIKKLGARIRAK